MIQKPKPIKWPDRLYKENEAKTDILLKLNLGLIYGRGKNVSKEITPRAEILMERGISRNVVFSHPRWPRGS